MRIFQWITVLAAIAACFGCGGKGGSPVVPPDSPDIESSITSQINYDNPGNRYILGLWEVYVSADRETIEMVPVRSSEMHLNLVNFLENVACTYCISFYGVEIVSPNEMKAVMQVKHPFDDKDEYTIFDVRGIFMSDSDCLFPNSGRSIGWSGDYPIVLDPDGYTQIFNPVEYPESSGPPMLTYFEGKCSFGDSPTATLNPYWAFWTDESRRMFRAGQHRSQTIWLSAPVGPFSFGYALDCSWANAGEVDDPLEDFPPEANCPEPYDINVWYGSGLTNTLGSKAQLYVEVFDHQGIETIDSVSIEAPGLFEDTIELSLSYAMGEESWMFEGIISNERAENNGVYPLLVRVVSNESDPNLGSLDAWNICRVNVGAEGWARTWGAKMRDHGRGVAVDSEGSVYVTGSFDYPIDLDPGPGVAWYSSEDDWDPTAYLSKFDSEGEFQHAIAWGGHTGIGNAEGWRVEVDAYGNVIVAGTFKGAVDFDPGPGSFYLPSVTGDDLFVCKFDQEMVLLWAKSWPLYSYTYDYTYWSQADIEVDQSGDVFITGYFGGTIDFDPGPMTDVHTGGGLYLAKINSNGQYEWTITWGENFGSNPYIGHGIAIDNTGNIFRIGGFMGTVDFDPGPGLFELTSNGNSDAFITSFTPDRQFLWAASWGGECDDIACSIAADTSGNTWVVGVFEETVDFDPGPGIDEITSNGQEDFFISKFDADFNYLLSRTWGSDNKERITGLNIDVDAQGNAYVCGNFRYSVDFDPGPGSDIYTPDVFGLNYFDFFLSRFNSAGEYQGVTVWSGPRDKLCMDLALDMNGNVYLTGDYHRVLDFNPGPGTDYHEAYGSYMDAFILKVNPNGAW